MIYPFGEVRFSRALAAFGATLAIVAALLLLVAVPARATTPIVDCSGNVTVDLDEFVVPAGSPQPSIVSVVDNGDTLTVTIRRYGYWPQVPGNYNDEVETVAKPTGCASETTTPSPTTAPASTTPGSPTTTPGAPSTTAASSRTLPATGSATAVAVTVALALCAAGGVMVLFVRRRVVD